MNNDSESLALSRIWKLLHKVSIIFTKWEGYGGPSLLDAKGQRDGLHFASMVIESLRIKPLTKPNC